MGKMILVVDDDLETLRLLEFMAITTETKVVVACSGEEALRKLQEGCYWKVITDYCMPGMDGITFSKQVKELYPDIEVIMMTGSIEADLHERAIRAGISKIISKPISSSLFLELLIGNKESL